MATLASALHVVRTLFERLLEVVVVGLMLGLALLVIVAVFLRYIGRPLFFYDEVASMLLAWVTYYGAALAAYRGAHIAFPGLVAAMPRPWRIVFVVFGKLVVIGFFVVLARLGFQVM
jgi:TRAP-type C4-dicarboxylate transport system permease small subunit